MKGIKNMGRRRIDRSQKSIQTFEITKPLKIRLEEVADKENKTLSAVIREILERYFEER